MLHRGPVPAAHGGRVGRTRGDMLGSSLDRTTTVTASDRPGPGAGEQHETILLVEDEPAVRQLFAIALTRAGYRVLEARNGQEAI